MSVHVLRSDDGKVKMMTFSCDHPQGCDTRPSDEEVMAGGGLAKLGWECGGGRHLCPEHRTTPWIRPAIEDIAKERHRQITVEGFTPESNDNYEPGTLAAAAACYAAGEKLPCWPWGDEWWKPGPTRRRDMEKAGALIAAEIEHNDRTTSDEEKE